MNGQNESAPPDWRGLCEELAGWIERSTRHYIRDPDVLIRARAVLAQPEPEVVGPTRRQLMLLADDMDMASVSDAAEYARAVLARWGRSASAPAAPGEVAELVEWLRSTRAARLTRAADLLEHYALPLPSGEV